MVEGIKEGSDFVFSSIYVEFVVKQELLETLQVEIDHIFPFDQAKIVWIRLSSMFLNIVCNRLKVSLRSLGTFLVCTVGLVGTIT